MMIGGREPVTSVFDHIWWSCELLYAKHLTPCERDPLIWVHGHDYWGGSILYEPTISNYLF